MRLLCTLDGHGTKKTTSQLLKIRGNILKIFSLISFYCHEEDSSINFHEPFLSLCVNDYIVTKKTTAKGPSLSLILSFQRETAASGLRKTILKAKIKSNLWPIKPGMNKDQIQDRKLGQKIMLHFSRYISGTIRGENSKLTPLLHSLSDWCAQFSYKDLRGRKDSRKAHEAFVFQRRSESVLGQIGYIPLENTNLLDSIFGSKK